VSQPYRYKRRVENEAKKCADYWTDYLSEFYTCVCRDLGTGAAVDRTRSKWRINVSMRSHFSARTRGSSDKSKDNQHAEKLHIFIFKVHG
jgi:hypothetical protein